MRSFYWRLFNTHQFVNLHRTCRQVVASSVDFDTDFWLIITSFSHDGFYLEIAVARCRELQT